MTSSICNQLNKSKSMHASEFKYVSVRENKQMKCKQEEIQMGIIQIVQQNIRPRANKLRFKKNAN